MFNFMKKTPEELLAEGKRKIKEEEKKAERKQEKKVKRKIKQAVFLKRNTLNRALKSGVTYVEIYASDLNINRKGFTGSDKSTILIAVGDKLVERNPGWEYKLKVSYTNPTIDYLSFNFPEEEEEEEEEEDGAVTCDICGCRIPEGELIIQTSEHELLSGVMPKPHYKEVVTVRCKSCWENGTGIEIE